MFTILHYLLYKCSEKSSILFENNFRYIETGILPKYKSNKMDLINKKFTINLTTLIGILSAISTIIGGYWYFKNTIETTRDSIKSANENYKELKNEIQFLRERLYEMAITYNRNVQIENEVQPVKYRESGEYPVKYERVDTIVAPPLKVKFVPLKRNLVKDTMDLSKIKVKSNLPLIPKIK